MFSSFRQHKNYRIYPVRNQPTSFLREFSFLSMLSLGATPELYLFSCGRELCVFVVVGGFEIKEIWICFANSIQLGDGKCIFFLLTWIFLSVGSSLSPPKECNQSKRIRNKLWIKCLFFYDLKPNISQWSQKKFE